MKVSVSFFLLILSWLPNWVLSFIFFFSFPMWNFRFLIKFERDFWNFLLCFCNSSFWSKLAWFYWCRTEGTPLIPCFGTYNKLEMDGLDTHHVSLSFFLFFFFSFFLFFDMVFLKSISSLKIGILDWIPSWVCGMEFNFLLLLNSTWIALALNYPCIWMTSNYIAKLT